MKRRDEQMQFKKKNYYFEVDRNMIGVRLSSRFAYIRSTKRKCDETGTSQSQR